MLRQILAIHRNTFIVTINAFVNLSFFGKMYSWIIKWMSLLKIRSKSTAEIRVILRECQLWFFGQNVRLHLHLYIYICRYLWPDLEPDPCLTDPDMLTEITEINAQHKVSNSCCWKPNFGHLTWLWPVPCPRNSILGIHQERLVQLGCQVTGCWRLTRAGPGGVWTPPLQVFRR